MEFVSLFVQSLQSTFQKEKLARTFLFCFFKKFVFKNLFQTLKRQINWINGHIMEFLR